MVGSILDTLRSASWADSLLALCLLVQPLVALLWLLLSHLQAHKDAQLQEILGRYDAVQRAVNEFMLTSIRSLSLPLEHMTEALERVRSSQQITNPETELETEIHNFKAKVLQATSDNQNSEGRARAPSKILFGTRPNPLKSLVLWALLVSTIGSCIALYHFADPSLPLVALIASVALGYLFSMLSYRHYGQVKSRRQRTEQQASLRVNLLDIRREFIADLTQSMQQSHTNLMNTSQQLSSIPQARGFFTGMQMLAKLNNGWVSVFKASDMNQNAPLFAVTPFLRKMITEQYQPYAKKNHVDLQAVIDDGLAFQIQPRDFEKLITILIDNAITYSKPGASIHLRGKRRGQKAIISVTDTGPGIANSILTTLFHPVDSPSDKPSKVSLDLQISKVILSRIGGELKISSKVDKGTVATLIAPRNHTAIKLAVPRHISRTSAPIT